MRQVNLRWPSEAVGLAFPISSALLARYLWEVHVGAVVEGSRCPGILVHCSGSGGHTQAVRMQLRHDYTLPRWGLEIVGILRSR